jgi:hypothetical protein
MRVRVRRGADADREEARRAELALDRREQALVGDAAVSEKITCRR